MHAPPAKATTAKTPAATAAPVPAVVPLVGPQPEKTYNSDPEEEGADDDDGANGMTDASGAKLSRKERKLMLARKQRDEEASKMKLEGDRSPLLLLLLLLLISLSLSIYLSQRSPLSLSLSLFLMDDEYTFIRITLGVVVGYSVQLGSCLCSDCYTAN